MSRPEVGLGVRGDTPDVARIARLADDSGFDVLTAFNDLGFGHPLPQLLAAASVTERVRLGVACYNPYTTHPVEIASQVSALDAVAPGRTYVGLAKGAWLDTAGIAQPRPVETVRSAAAVIERLVGGAVPLLIGGWGPQMVALAGEIADELKVGGSANPDLVPVMRERLGRTSETRIVMGAIAVVDEDRRAARERALGMIEMYFDVVARYDPTVGGGGLTDDLLDRFALAGTPGDIALHTRKLFDAGASRVEFGVTSYADAEVVARRVLPEFR